MANFWEKLPKGFMVLAPMDDITDEAFRQVLVRYGKPDVLYTEFVSADGLMSDGRKKLLSKLQFSKNEHPIVAQIFGANPKNIYGAAKLIGEMGFDGIDINMGCPDRAVMKQGSGAALIEKPTLAREIIRAAKEGFGGPVSVKTRLGIKRDILETWLPELLLEKPDAVIIHCRTANEKSKAPAHWERVADAKNIVGLSNTKIVGNGDVWSMEDAQKRISETNADGVMIGRGSLGNPFVFGKHTPSVDELVESMVYHAEIYEKINMENPRYQFDPVRKHLSKYLHNFRGAKELREKVLSAKSAAEVREIVGRGILSS